MFWTGVCGAAQNSRLRLSLYCIRNFSYHRRATAQGGRNGRSRMLPDTTMTDDAVQHEAAAALSVENDDRRTVTSKASASVELVHATILRSTAGPFNIVFKHDTLNKMVAIEAIGEIDVSDDRALMKVDDTVARVNGVRTTGLLLPAVQRLVSQSGQSLNLLLERSPPIVLEPSIDDVRVAERVSDDDDDESDTALSPAPHEPDAEQLALTEGLRALEQATRSLRGSLASSPPQHAVDEQSAPASTGKKSKGFRIARGVVRALSFEGSRARRRRKEDDAKATGQFLAVPPAGPPAPDMATTGGTKTARSLSFNRQSTRERKATPAADLESLPRLPARSLSFNRQSTRERKAAPAADLESLPRLPVTNSGHVTLVSGSQESTLIRPRAPLDVASSSQTPFALNYDPVPGEDAEGGLKPWLSPSVGHARIESDSTNESPASPRPPANGAEASTSRAAANPPKLPQRTLGCVLESFAAETVVELSVARGEIVVLIKEGAPEGWTWACSPAGAGLIPSDFVQLLDVPTKQPLQADGMDEQKMQQRKASSERAQRLEKPAVHPAAWPQSPAHLASPKEESVPACNDYGPRSPGTSWPASVPTTPPRKKPTVLFPPLPSSPEPRTATQPATPPGDAAPAAAETDDAEPPAAAPAPVSPHKVGFLMAVESAAASALWGADSPPQVETPADSIEAPGSQDTPTPAHPQRVRVLAAGLARANTPAAAPEEFASVALAAVEVETEEGSIAHAQPHGEQGLSQPSAPAPVNSPHEQDLLAASPAYSVIKVLQQPKSKKLQRAHAKLQATSKLLAAMEVDPLTPPVLFAEAPGAPTEAAAVEPAEAKVLSPSDEMALIGTANDVARTDAPASAMEPSPGFEQSRLPRLSELVSKPEATLPGPQPASSGKQAIEPHQEAQSPAKVLADAGGAVLNALGVMSLFSGGGGSRKSLFHTDEDIRPPKSPSKVREEPDSSTEGNAQDNADAGPQPVPPPRETPPTSPPTLFD